LTYQPLVVAAQKIELYILYILGVKRKKKGEKRKKEREKTKKK
jgi:hypothetical protein